MSSVIRGKLNEVPEDQQLVIGRELHELLKRACGPENKFYLMVWTDEADSPMIIGDERVTFREMLEQLAAARDHVLDTLKKKTGLN